MTYCFTVYERACVSIGSECHILTYIIVLIVCIGTELDIVCICTHTMVYVVCVCVCCVCCSGASQVMDVVETMKRLDELRERRETLASRERELDEQQRRMEQCLRNITDDTINEQYPTLPQKFIDGRNWGGGGVGVVLE